MELKNDPASIRVTFRNVRGGLHASGHPSGFSLHTSDGTPVPIIYKTTLDQNVVFLHLTTNVLPPGVALWYGWGIDPYCNIHGTTDATIPVFGPCLVN